VITLKDAEATQPEWNRKAKDAVNALTRRLLGVGATTARPVSPTDGQMFYDDTLKRPVWYNTADAVWRGAEGPGAPVTKTADFTLAATDNMIFSNRGATNTVTLPAASLWPGRRVYFKTIQAFTLVSASSNVVPLAGGAASTAILAGTAGKYAWIVSDATDWHIFEAN
jgi:hypothetical protein